MSRSWPLPPTLQKHRSEFYALPDTNDDEAANLPLLNDVEPADGVALET